MKKILNISVIAALAVLPLAAHATNGDIVAGNPTGRTAQGVDTTIQTEDAVTASASPKYALAVEGEANSTVDGNVATAGYVKGAYNAAIKAINKVSETATNAANQDLSNISATGKANVSAQGTVDLTKNDYGANTVGKALVDIKTTADNAADKNLSNLNSAGTTVITNNVTANAAGGTFSSTTGLSSGTLGTAIDELSSEKLDKADATPASNGSYITTGNTVAGNLGALDTQVKANADAIGALDNTYATKTGAAATAAAAVNGATVSYTLTGIGTTTATVTGTVPVVSTWGTDAEGTPVNVSMQNNTVVTGLTGNTAEDTYTATISAPSNFTYQNGQ